MSIYQCTGEPTISLPNGISSLPPQQLPCLERFTTIIIWFDNDPAGIEGTSTIVRKLGIQRCLVVQPTFSLRPGQVCGIYLSALLLFFCKSFRLIAFFLSQRNQIITIYITPQKPPKDANEAMLQGHNLKEAQKQARKQDHKQICQFRDMYQHVYNMFINSEKYQGIQIQSMPQLMKIQKGIRREEQTIVTGSTGVGKTTLLTQLSLDMCIQNIPTLWGSFEIPNSRLTKTLLQQYSHILKIPLQKPLIETNYPLVSSKFEEQPQYFLRFYGSTCIDEIIDAMDYAVYVYDVQQILLDNLQFMLSGQGGKYIGDKFDIQDLAIERFRKFATENNVHIILVIHPRKEADNVNLGLSSIFGSAKSTQEADNVLILQHGLSRSIIHSLKLQNKSISSNLSPTSIYQDPLIGEIITNRFRTIDVRKNRWDGDQGSVTLQFDKNAYKFNELNWHDIHVELPVFIERQKRYSQIDIIKQSTVDSVSKKSIKNTISSEVIYE